MAKSSDGAIAPELGMEDSDRNNIKKENNDGERATGGGRGRRAAEGATGGVQPATNSANNEKKVNEVRDEVERAARDQVGTEKRAGRAEPDGVQVHKASTGDCEDPADNRRHGHKSGLLLGTIRGTSTGR